MVFLFGYKVIDGIGASPLQFGFRKWMNEDSVMAYSRPQSKTQPVKKYTPLSRLIIH
jgi:hypothetical protein